MNMHSRIQHTCCPTCGGYIGEALTPKLVEKQIHSSMRRVIFRALAAEIGKPVMKQELLEIVYPNPDNEPGHGWHVIRTQMANLRNDIEPYGWTVANTTGRGVPAQYRLIPLEAGA